MTTPTGIEALVCADIAARQMVGLKKYGQTLADNPAELHARLQHAYEECLDQACYLKWAIESIKPMVAKRLPQIGDQYLRGDTTAVVEGVVGGQVHYRMLGERYSASIDEFERLAYKSVANGAVFHPAK